MVLKKTKKKKNETETNTFSVGFSVKPAKKLKSQHFKRFSVHVLVSCYDTTERCQAAFLPYVRLLRQRQTVHLKSTKQYLPTK